MNIITQTRKLRKINGMHIKLCVRLQNILQDKNSSRKDQNCNYKMVAGTVQIENFARQNKSSKRQKKVFRISGIQTQSAPER